MTSLILFKLYNNNSKEPHTLTSFPINIGNLISLEDFVLIHTQIQFIPYTIRNLTNLNRIQLQDNTNLASLPETICDIYYNNDIAGYFSYLVHGNSICEDAPSCIIDDLGTSFYESQDCP